LEKHNWERSYIFIIVSYMILDDICRRNIWNMMLLYTMRILMKGTPLQIHLADGNAKTDF
jgi:hypothetical protein